MSNKTLLLGQFVEKLSLSGSYEEAFQSLEKFVQALDFEVVLYTANFFAKGPAK